MRGKRQGLLFEEGLKYCGCHLYVFVEEPAVAVKGVSVLERSDGGVGGSEVKVDEEEGVVLVLVLVLEEEEEEEGKRETHHQLSTACRIRGILHA